MVEKHALAGLVGGADRANQDLASVGKRALALEMGGEGVTLVSRAAGRESRVPVGRAAWGKSATLFTSTGEERVAASGAWTADDTFTAKVWLHESPRGHPGAEVQG
jgi:hypothetical protein